MKNKFYTDSQKRVRPISNRRVSTGTMQKGVANFAGHSGCNIWFNTKQAKEE
jgi:hypothetical protein